MRSLGLLVLLLLSSPVALSAPLLEPEPGNLATMDTLVVTGKNGIQEVDLTGKVLRTITKTVPEGACFLPQREGVLFIGPDNNLWKVMLANGVEKRVAKLPKKITSCKGSYEHPRGQALSIREFSTGYPESRFEADNSGAKACLALWNEKEWLGVRFQVDLRTGKVVSDAKCCDEEKSILALTCRPTDWFAFPPAPVDRSKHPYGLSEEGGGHLLKWGPDGKTTRIATLGEGDFREDQVSPSGTWVAVTGNEMQGDFIHVEVFILNRTDGRLWSVVREGAPALTPEQMADLAKHQVKTEDTVGDRIRWIPGHDLLLLNDHLLVTPASGALDLHGTVVF